MSNFENLQKSLSKKLTLQDYNTEKQQKVKTAEKKIKITVYLNEDSMQKLNKLCSKNIIENGKQDKSLLVSKAVDLLYENEF